MAPETPPIPEEMIGLLFFVSVPTSLPLRSYQVTVIGPPVGRVSNLKTAQRRLEPRGIGLTRTPSSSVAPYALLTTPSRGDLRKIVRIWSGTCVLPARPVS